jgi:hypothetical protein
MPPPPGRNFSQFDKTRARGLLNRFDFALQATINKRDAVEDLPEVAHIQREAADIPSAADLEELGQGRFDRDRLRDCSKRFPEILEMLGESTAKLNERDPESHERLVQNRHIESTEVVKIHRFRTELFQYLEATSAFAAATESHRLEKGPSDNVLRPTKGIDELQEMQKFMGNDLQQIWSINHMYQRIKSLYKSLETARSDLQSQFDTKEKELVQANQASLDKVQTEASLLKASLGEVEQKLEASTDELKKALLEYELTVKAAKLATTNHAEEMTRAVRDANTQRETAQQKLDEKQQSIDALNDRVISLQAMNTHGDKQKNEQIQKLDSTNRDYLIEISKLKAIIEPKDQRISDLVLNMSDLRELNANVDEKYKNKMVKIDQLEREKITLADQIDEYAMDVEELHELQMQNKTMEEKESRLIRELDSVRSENTVLLRNQQELENCTGMRDAIVKAVRKVQAITQDPLAEQVERLCQRFSHLESEVSTRLSGVPAGTQMGVDTQMLDDGPTELESANVTLEFNLNQKRRLIATVLRMSAESSGTDIKVMTDQEKDQAAATIVLDRASQVSYNCMTSPGAFGFIVSMVDLEPIQKRLRSVSITRDLVSVKLGFPVQHHLLESIEAIHLNEISIDFADALQTLLDALEFQAMEESTRTTLCLASCRLLELAVRNGVQDRDQTPDQFLERITTVVGQIQAVPALLRTYLSWLEGVIVHEVDKTLVELMKEGIPEHLEEFPRSRRSLYASDGMVFMIDETNEDGQTMSCFTPSDLILKISADHKNCVELSFKPSRRHRADTVGVPPPFRTHLEESLTWFSVNLTKLTMTLRCELDQARWRGFREEEVS